MIILNTSFHMVSSLEKEFINWAKTAYLPAANASGIFSEALLLKILTEIDSDVSAFALQLKSSSLEDSTRWHDETAASLKGDLTRRWGKNVVYFTTYMEAIES